MTRNWKKDLNKFEEFFKKIDIQKYTYFKQMDGINEREVFRL